MHAPILTIDPAIAEIAIPPLIVPIRAYLIPTFPLPNNAENM
jgi:hypothetical protein